jgi:hypothetical protein
MQRLFNKKSAIYNIEAISELMENITDRLTTFISQPRNTGCLRIITTV